MKVIALILLSLSAQAQFKKYIPSLATTFFAGANEGIAEGLKWHYYNYDQRFNLSDQYWNPKVSYTNKYKGGITANGPKFPGSTTALVWTTDGYHMTRMVRNASFVTSIVIYPAKKQKWYKHVLYGLGYWVTYQAGFNLTYL